MNWKSVLMTTIAALIWCACILGMMNHTGSENPMQVNVEDRQPITSTFGDIQPKPKMP